MNVKPINVAEGFLFTLLTWILTKGKLTWQWKTQRFEHVSHVSPIKMVMFHCHVSFPGGNSMVFFEKIQIFPIETGEIPASYVSLSEGRGCFFPQKNYGFSQSLRISDRTLQKKGVGEPL